MSKAFVAGFVAGLALLIVVGVGASRLHHQSAEEAAFQGELPDATPVQIGFLTEQQRIHSKLYAHYLSERKGQGTIRDLASKQSKGQIVFTTTLPAFGPLLKPETPEKYFGDLAHSSDAIIRGRVIKKTSQITEDGGFVFTDYDVSVSQVIKNNPIAPLKSGGVVTVTWPGGKVLIEGVIVKALDQNFGLPSINNRDLVLFLRFIDETGAYGPANCRGGFELEGFSIRPLTSAHFPPGVLGRTDSFLETLTTISR